MVHIINNNRSWYHLDNSYNYCTCGAKTRPSGENGEKETGKKNVTDIFGPVKDGRPVCGEWELMTSYSDSPRNRAY